MKKKKTKQQGFVFFRIIFRTYNMNNIFPE